MTLGCTGLKLIAFQRATPMEITDSFLTLLQNFAPVFTAPTYQTFVVIVTGWIISQRHRYVTELIYCQRFNVGKRATGRGSIASSATPPRTSDAVCHVPGHHAARRRPLVPRASPSLSARRRHPLSQARTRPLRSGPGIRSRPAAVSSQARQPLIQFGAIDRVRARSLVISPCPPGRVPRKVFSLAHHQGEKNPKGKKGQQKPAKPKHDPNHRTRPELALELIIMVAQWFPNEEIIVSGDRAYGGQRHPPPAAQRSPHQPCASQWSTLRAVPPKKKKRKGPVP